MKFCQILMAQKSKQAANNMDLYQRVWYFDQFVFIAWTFLFNKTIHQHTYPQMHSTAYKHMTHAQFCFTGLWTTALSSSTHLLQLKEQIEVFDSQVSGTGKRIATDFKNW